MMRLPLEVEGRLSPVFSEAGMVEEDEKRLESLRGMSPDKTQRFELKKDIRRWTIGSFDARNRSCEAIAHQRR